jgi:hypothetical protein
LFEYFKINILIFKGDIHSIGLLPDKLKTELALHVNLETLRKVILLNCINKNKNDIFNIFQFKVTIFQECQPEFLHDLVLKMRAYIFTPGDMICRKGMKLLNKVFN